MPKQQLKSVIKKFNTLVVPNQKIGNTKLNVMPFIHDGTYVELPVEYKLWEKTLNEILLNVPVQKDAQEHYITINSEFFTKSGTQRREGVHMDGNFCVDPTFVTNNLDYKLAWDTKPTWGMLKPIKSWGGVAPRQSPRPSWGGVKYSEKADNSHVEMDWVLPYDITIPIGKYVSDTKGGLFVVSSEVGTRAWSGDFYGEVADEGSFDLMKEQLTKEKEQYIPKNKLVFMTSNTPHETLHIEKGTRRTFMRLTLNHNYDNEKILSA